MFPLRLSRPQCASTFVRQIIFAGLCSAALSASAAAQTRNSTVPVARLVTGYAGAVASSNDTRPLRTDEYTAIAPGVRRAAGTTPAVGISFADADEQRVFDLINRERRAQGLMPLVLDEDLSRLARAHSGDMAVRSFFDHTNPEGVDAAGRARRGGVRGWRSLGENIALNQGYRDPAAFAVERWMKSAKHRANITAASWTHTGLGVARAADGTFYFTQVFTMR